ncbi:hypothetical protein [Deinococcus yavapaiensis]|uniref:hypothetical protein n=1 Tax=Deinococcus yavapaiensis TaxID=309889 RepID=UPI001475F8AC|nr:hypothetical protein [Deinococcus yavapaiensis]
MLIPPLPPAASASAFKEHRAARSTRPPPSAVEFSNALFTSRPEDRRPSVTPID